ncbi:MAG: Aspartyl/glutamyl-tRNA(Asn/Gln) amidotransferase subunit B [Parcubacteria group bacterium GW2011_GWA2_47_10]|nr:MAG: Aspartyl/glutamyl-tRNA(Asn/Gln) amidotransferase subunit B [Parcubacteria group bacterium GW2011_GWA2_47_10]
MKLDPIIGLEIHAELNTRTKMFCDSLNDPDEKHPNINICPVCMGHPGTLPVINQEAVKKVIQVGLALGGTTPEFSQFDRKNYFYPDLPKGYQISQYEHPLVSGGVIEVRGRPIRITRVHLEEDTGRLIHNSKSGGTLVDFNRAGVPLMELVTEPDLRTGSEVREFGETLQQILRYIGASSADMEKGQMRVEVNVSLIPANASRISQIPEGKEKEYIRGIDGQFVHIRDLGTKVEIKNINSFKFAADAVDYEIERQSKVLDDGGSVVQETRGWNERKGESFSQRLKQKQVRFTDEYGIDEKIASVIVREKTLADYFENIVSELKEWEQSLGESKKKNGIKLASNFLVGDFLRLLNETATPVLETLITPENFGEFISYIAEDEVSSVAAKIVFEEMFRTGRDPSDIIAEKNLAQVSDAGKLEESVKKVIEMHPKPVADYKNGAQNALQFLVGQVMKETKGAANPKMVQDIMKKLIVGSE